MRASPLFGLVLSATLLGCSKGSRISASATLSPPLSVAMLTVTVIDGNRQVTWTGSDFRPRTSNATPTTPEWGLQSDGGEIVVDFRLDSAGVALSQGSIQLPRRSDWRWGVTIVGSTADPRLGCFGCVGSKAFALSSGYRTVGHDSAWVVWGGNSISNPVTY